MTYRQEEQLLVNTYPAINKQGRVNGREIMRIQLSIWVGGCALGLLAGAQGQVPPVINYQGSVTVAGTNYQGTGYFKFALVSGNGSQTFWSNDRTSVSGGEPRTGLPLTVVGGVYEVALGDEGLTNMMPVPAAVFANADVHLRVWFSDGQMPFQPIVPDQRFTAVGYAMMAADVPAGAVTADKLAAGAVTTGKLAANAVTAAKIAPGAVGPAQLAPEAAAASLQASGGLVLSDQPNATNLLRAGFQPIGTVLTQSDQWQTFGMGLYAPEPRASAAAVWTGKEMIIFGGNSPTATLLSTGARYDPAADGWTPIATNKTLSPSVGTVPNAVWTGSEMVVLWGNATVGSSPATVGGIYNAQGNSWRSITLTKASINLSASIVLWTGHEVLVWRGDGAALRFDPVSGSWNSISRTNAPSARTSSTAVWTGQEMIVWGGVSTQNNSGLLDGARYNPRLNTWKPMASLNAPAYRYLHHSAVWTGKEMIVWAGNRASASATPTANGAAYDPTANTWRTIATTNQPTPRSNQLAIWSGSRMIIWGGLDFSNNFLNTGGQYNPRTDTWSPVATEGTPEALWGYAAVWADDEFIVWGGRVAQSTSGLNYSQASYSNAGARYRPDRNTWQPMVTVALGRVGHTAVWTGHELLLWGGRPLESATTRAVLQSGVRFDSVSRRWSALSSVNAPSPRQNHQAVWTGKEMIIWGGEGYGPSPNEPSVQNFGPLASGARYNPVTDTWTAIETNGAPTSRTGHSIVWSGEEAIVFGGRTLGTDFRTNYLNSGGRYNPRFDSWTSLPSEQAPASRQRHFAVWTGSAMVIWGGQGPIGNSPLGTLNNGASYDPFRNEWSPINTNGAPATVVNGSAIWTGQEMLVFTRSNVGAAGQIAAGRYDPVADRWTAVMGSGAPVASLATSDYSTFTVVWSGREALVWGSLTNPTGARYDPVLDAWTPMTLMDAPKNRRGHTAVWTGKSMLIFGGVEGTGTTSLPNTVVNYSLSKTVYLYRHP